MLGSYVGRVLENGNNIQFMLKKHMYYIDKYLLCEMLTSEIGKDDMKNTVENFFP